MKDVFAGFAGCSTLVGIYGCVLFINIAFFASVIAVGIWLAGQMGAF